MVEWRQDTEAAEDVVRPEPMDLSDVVEQSLDLVRPIAERKGLRIRVRPPTQAVTLNTDPRKVRQIIVNLLANAVKFTESGEVVLLVRAIGCDPEVRACIEVTDTGIGIAVDDQTRVFEPFWRADPTSKNTDGSTGLGLSVARELARLLGGDLVVSWSAPGRGTTFMASFPASYVGRA